MVQKHVFISYRHESPEHARAVRRLGELLRQAQIPVALDQFYLEEHPGGPELGGWPKWCEDCANQSACVLIVASEGWFAAYDKTAPRALGLGAAVEADIFRQELYDEAGSNARIRLAFLHDIAADKVPRRLRAWHQFRPFDNGDQLIQLVRWVIDCLGLKNIELPKLRWPEPLAFRPDLANRTMQEWPAIVDLLAGRSRKRILLYEGAAGLGKSTLLRQAADYAKRLDIPVIYIDFNGGGTNVEDILGQFYLEWSEHLPNFSREGANKTHFLRKDFRSLRQPVLIIFDTYEDCAPNKPVVDWLNQQLITEVETAPGLAVIIAGEKIPDYAKTVWHDLAQHLPLTPITDIEHWEFWVEAHYPNFREKGDLLTILKLAEGNPGTVSNFCAAISKT